MTNPNAQMNSPKKPETKFCPKEFLFSYKICESCKWETPCKVWRVHHDHIISQLPDVEEIIDIICSYGGCMESETKLAKAIYNRQREGVE